MEIEENQVQEQIQETGAVAPQVEPSQTEVQSEAQSCVQPEAKPEATQAEKADSGLMGNPYTRDASDTFLQGMKRSFWD